MNEITIYSPASIANLGCGYDVLGLALEGVGDKIRIKLSEGNEINIINNTPFEMPLGPNENAAGIAAKAFFDKLKEPSGLEITLIEKIQPGSGLGSSGSSSAGVVAGLNALFGNPFTRLQLTELAMRGEAYISGKGHADNVGASIYGGLILVRSYNPLDIIELEFPEELWISIIFPLVEIKTVEARQILKEYLPLQDAITQWGNLAGLVAGFQKNDHDIIRRSLKDVVAEPLRSLLIPKYNPVKEMALSEGAIAFNISGSGPSMFSLCENEMTAKSIGQKGKQIYQASGIPTMVFQSKINSTGAEVIG